MSTELRIRSPAGEQFVQLDGPTVLGRDASCDVVIDSVRLSRRHAEFVPTAAGVEVRDLESRNGVLLNGTRVESGLLGPGDKVVMGDVSVTLRQAGVPIERARPAPVSGPSADPDRTSLLQPDAGPFRPPGVEETAGERTTLLPAGGLPGPASGTTPSRAPRLGTAPLATAGTAPPGQPAAPAGRSYGSVGRLAAGLLGFPGRLATLLVALAVAVFLVAAVPVLLEQGRAGEATAEARVTNLARLLAAENVQRLSTAGRLAASLGAVADVGGVRAALVLGPDGRVLAPTERLDEALTDLPTFGDVRNIRGVLAARVDGMYEAVSSMDDGARRLGVVWVRFDPMQAAGGRGSGGLLLSTSLLFAVVLALGGALVVRRMVTSRLEGFAVDVELAIGKQGVLAGSRDALPGLGKVADAVEYLLERLDAHPPPAGHSRRGPAQSSRQSRPPQAAAVRVDSPARPTGTEGALVLDSGFVVQNADARAMALLGVGGSIDGKHLLEAVPDQALVTAVIDCIAALDQGATGSHVFETEAGAGVREIEATRTPDGHIRITMTGA